MDTERVVVLADTHLRAGHGGGPPASPTRRRRQPCATYGELVLGGGRVIEHRILAVGS